jgi:signal transduction histidine kinase
MKRLLPSSLLGQVLLAIAIALVAAQAFNAVLLYRGAVERQQSASANALAFRLLGPERRGSGLEVPPELRETRRARGMRALGLRLERSATDPIVSDDARLPALEERLRDILRLQGYAPGEIAVVRRSVDDDPRALRFLATRARRQGNDIPETLLLAAVRSQDAGEWRIARVAEGPRIGRRALAGVVIQTLVLTLVLFGVLWLVLRRITRPLAALTARTKSFAAAPHQAEPLASSGPNDVRELIEAHNALETRIASLLDEKDVMLGAIGHDLKTPLAALRVRIESVADETQRSKMAAGVIELDRMLDDILSLARIGRPQDAAEMLDLAPLVSGVVEEYEDRDRPVMLEHADKAVGQFRASWIRRGLRNLIDNALRYGEVARVSLRQDGDTAVLTIADDGPGIPEDRIAAMMEPFRRGETSRNRATGGSGLGLTLARAIAEQHGGALTLANRDGGGLEAVLRLPL